MKTAKALLWSLVALAVALSLAVAVPAYAANVGLTKGVTPPGTDVYNLTDTIHYTMMIINMSNTEDLVVEAVWDVLPNQRVVYPTGPSLPYTLGPGENQTYTYDWVATRTRNETATNTFYAHGYQVSTFDDPFSEKIEKSVTVIGQEVGGTASLVNKLWLVAPWAILLGCAGIAALVVLRKRRQA